MRFALWKYDFDQFEISQHLIFVMQVPDARGYLCFTSFLTIFTYNKFLPQIKKNMKYKSAEEALKAIKPGDRVFIHGGAATPTYLLDRLADRAGELWNVELVSISMQGRAAIMDAAYKSSFRMNSLFVSENVRHAVNEGRADYVPIFLSEIPILFKRNILPIDVALVQVSPPDKHGFCSLGVSVDVAATAVKTAKHVIAQVNPRMPRTMGDGIIHQDEFDVMVSMEQELPEICEAESRMRSLLGSVIIVPSSSKMGQLCRQGSVQYRMRS
jgi:hypothetical protein